jgi:hypothetical protein
MVPEDMIVPTYRVISRHKADCPYKDKGQNYVKCECKKHIAVYDPRITNPIERQKTIPARTRDWEVAERIAVAYRDQHDPDKARATAAEAQLKAMQMKTESLNVTIEKAVSMFLAAKRKEGISPNRIERYIPLLGNVDPQTLTFQANRRGNKGRLSAWLDTLNPRPVYISDLTPVLIEEFRNSFDFGSDLTDFGTFGDLKRFLQYCVDRGWSSLIISRRQMAGINAPRVKAGSRTTAFSDEQYDNIIAAIKNKYPDHDPKDAYRDAHRLRAFIELMRYGGLALGDAVFFNLNTMSDDGHLKYRRRKTWSKTVKFAQPKLLPHVVDLLKTTIPIDGDLNRPFYDKNLAEDTNTGYWSAALKEVFKAAGIEIVHTDIRDREPHSHMLRDTFAVGQIRTQYTSGLGFNPKVIADALGDTVPVFLKSYAPWIEEYERVHKEAQDQIVDAQAAELAKRQADQTKKITNIAEGRR